MAAEFGVDRHIDAYLCVIALSQVMRAALEMKRATGDALLRDACDQFQSDLPDAKDLRDVLTHFDKYERGTGDLQVAKIMGPLNIFTESGEGRFWLRINHLKIELGSASEAADDLAYEAISAADRLRTPSIPKGNEGRVCLSSRVNLILLVSIARDTNGGGAPC
jgi:hypothetical protein